MNQNVNRNGLKLKESGPIWKVNVGVKSQFSNNSIKELGETKFWKIKVILN